MKSPLAAHFNIVQDMASKYLEGDRCMVGVSNLQDLGDLRCEWPCAKSALSLYFLGQRTLETQLYRINLDRHACGYWRVRGGILRVGQSCPRDQLRKYLGSPGNNKRERARSNVEGESGDARKRDK